MYAVRTIHKHIAVLIRIANILLRKINKVNVVILAVPGAPAADAEFLSERGEAQHLEDEDDERCGAVVGASFTT